MGGHLLARSWCCEELARVRTCRLWRSTLEAGVSLVAQCRSNSTASVPTRQKQQWLPALVRPRSCWLLSRLTEPGGGIPDAVPNPQPTLCLFDDGKRVG